MTSALQVFSYKEQEMRTVMVDGEVWFVAKDVCDILELNNVSKAIQELDDDERSSLTISEGTSPKGGNPNMNIINESGVYALIFKSRKPEAKAFSRWVRHEVLPQIRQTGSYSVVQPKPMLIDPMQGAKVVFDAAGITGNQLALALDRLYKTYTGQSALEGGDVVLTAPTQNQLLTPTQIGEHFGGMSPKLVNKKLAYAGYQRKVGNRWEATEQGRPYAVMQDVGKWHGGTPVRQLKWDSAILCVFRELIS